MLGLCRMFESDGQDDEATFAGTERHLALWDLLRGDPSLVNLLDADQQNSVKDAWGFIRANAPSLTGMVIEQADAITVGEHEITCTPDLISTPYVFDLKSRERNYEAQLAAYALCVMDRAFQDWATAFALFTIPRFRARRLDFTREAAERLILNIIEAPQEPTPNDYCSWCCKAHICPALAERALTVKAGREDWKLETYHPSEITRPSEMGKAKRLAKLMRVWCDSVDYHARQMMVEQHIPIPGFKIQNQASRSFDNLIDVWKATGLPDLVFLKCCDLTMERLIEAYATANGIGKAAAKRQLEAKLDHLGKKTPVKKLVSEKEPHANV